MRITLLQVQRFLITAFVTLSMGIFPALAQTGRPISGVIAATDKPIAVSYVNEAGETIGRIVGVGEPIYLNDEITTPAGASLQVLLRDQTVFSIGPNSTLVFDEFIFDPTSQDELALTASVKKGSFKFISGKISKLKPGAMTLKLPNATASVRGTSVVGRVDETGASDIVLLTGAVQVATPTAPAVDLVQPGWGVSVGETGTASEPTPFSPEDIDTIIKDVETGGDEEAGEEAATQTAAQNDEQAEEEPSEEAVETVAEVVREAGSDVTEEEIATIIKAADGDPEAVAEAIVKVIVQDRIQSGDIDAEAFEQFEALAAARAEAGDDANIGELFRSGEFTIEDIPIEDIKIEDLGLPTLAFENGGGIVDAVSSRLDVDALGFPKIDDNGFGFATLQTDDFQFEGVNFDTSAFDATQIKVTQRLDIKDVSRLIIGDSLGDTGNDAPVLTVFDILTNAEYITEQVEKREANFGFNQAQNGFNGTDDKEDTQQETAFGQVPNFGDEAGGNEELPQVPRLLFGQKVEEDGTVKTVIVRSDFAKTAPDETSEADTPDVPSYENANALLKEFSTNNPEAETNREPEAYTNTNNLPSEEEIARAEFEEFLDSLRKDTLSDDVNVLNYYVNGKTSAQWLTLQSGNSLGNAEDYGSLISQSYGGSANFSDSFTVSDAETTFKARASYNVNLNYDTAAVTGSFVLSNMSLNNQTYYSGANTTSHEEIISNLSLSGRSNAYGTLSTGGSIEDVNIATVDFHNSTNASEITSRVRTTLDMSVGSAQVLGSAIDGTLGEFTVEAEEYSCSPTCNSLTGSVGREVSVVEGKR